jgi:hypothetical protein
LSEAPEIALFGPEVQERIKHLTPVELVNIVTYDSHNATTSTRTLEIEADAEPGSFNSLILI